MKTITFSSKDVKLIVDTIDIEEMAASAAISLNPNVTWMKLVLTDDKFNANKQRIPREEYANILRTGLYMPLKMAFKEISEGHAGTFPVGTIAHLKTEGETIEALAALWGRERKEDIEVLKERYNDGKSIDISWEVTYKAEDVEDGGIALRDVSMNAATIVGIPAYQGRTPVVALSSDKKTEGDSSSMDTIERKDHEKILADAEEKYDSKLAELTEELEGVKKELDEIKPEYAELKEFKEEIDAERAKAEKLTGIKQKFEKAEIDVSEEYFESRADTFLEMTEDQLDFFIQELVAAFAEDKSKDDGESKASTVNLTSSNVPNIRGKVESDLTTEEILKHLEEQDKN